MSSKPVNPGAPSKPRDHGKEWPTKGDLQLEQSSVQIGLLKRCGMSAEPLTCQPAPAERPLEYKNGKCKGKVKIHFSCNRATPRAPDG